MENKKAITHIEVIISLVIFTGFIIFLFAFFRPIPENETSLAVLDSAERGIRSLAEINYSQTSIFLKDTAISKLSLYNCFDIIKNDMKAGDKVVIFDESGERVDAQKAGNSIKIEKSIGKFYRIYFSDEFEQGSLSNCLLLDETDYSLGLEIEDKAFSQGKINELIARYNNNYENLKKELNIPSQNNFGFSIRRSSGEETGMVAVKNIPVGISVIAREVSAKILYNDGRIEYVIMNIRAW